MRIKSGIVVALVLPALCWGYIAHGQNRDKTADGAKKESDAGKKAAVAAQTGADRTKKPVDAGKKPSDNAKSTGAKPPVSNPTGANPTGANPSGANPAATDAAESPDEKAIRASAAAFTKIYNDHDSKALAALFAPKAEMIDEEDQVVKGREAIEKAFAEVFKANPKSSMQVEVESLRVLTPSLAIEEGTARSKDSPDDPEDATTYVAIHVKIDGKWLLACVRDWDASPAELTPHDHLQELAWLVGEWVEESPDSVIHTNCTWHDNGNFLMQEFKVQIGGDIAMSGTMRIGWDAVRKQFKSWVFDSHGGHAEAYWLRDGDQWIVKSLGATAAGEAAAATTVYRPVDGDTIVWSSSERVIDGQRRDDIEPITVKRRPPLPAE